MPQLIAVVQGAVTQDEQSIAREAITFETLLDLINCAAPAEEEPDLWRTLLQELGKIKNSADFFLATWDNYATLLRHSSRALFSPQTDKKSSAQIKKDAKLIEPFLKILLWPEYGAFLSLQLPLPWTVTVTNRLVFDTLAKRAYLREETVHNLEQEYSSELEALFKQLSQEAQQQHWATTTAFFDVLASKAYGKKMDLWFLLLNSPLGKFEQNSGSLAQMVHLKPSETVPFLKRSGPQYLPLDPPDEMARIVMAIFKDLAQGEHHREKMEVLFDWLAAKPLINWFSRRSSGERHLADVLTAANLNAQECGQFFDRYGKTYIPLYPSSSILLNLFERYAHLQERRRIFYLQSWLDCSLTQQTLEKVLQAAQLQSTDKVAFLQQYGQRYLTFYSRSQVLHSYVQEFLDWLLTADLALFKNKEPSLTEKLLLFLYNCSAKQDPVFLPFSAQWLYAWLTVVHLMREPVLLSQKPERVATSVEKILNEKSLSATTRAQLIRELSLAWLADERQLVELLDPLY